MQHEQPRVLGLRRGGKGDLQRLADCSSGETDNQREDEDSGGKSAETFGVDGPATKMASKMLENADKIWSTTVQLANDAIRRARAGTRIRIRGFSLGGPDGLLGLRTSVWDAADHQDAIVRASSAEQ